jgi:hypothetical protein
MDDGTRRDLLLGWRVLAGLLIYPITVLAGLNALLRIVSACCVALDSWTPEGALGNLAFGFPALAGIAALWVSTIQPPAWVARDRARFVLVATGLLAGMLMECLFLRAGFALEDPRFRSPGLGDLWTFAGALVAGAVNLVLVIAARDGASQRAMHRAHSPAPPAPHVSADQDLRPVILRPFVREETRPMKPKA